MSPTVIPRRKNTVVLCMVFLLTRKRLVTLLTSQLNEEIMRTNLLSVNVQLTANYCIVGHLSQISGPPKEMP